MVAEDLATAIMDLDVGRFECRVDRRGPECVLLCHGGHNAGLAQGEELFAAHGYTVPVPSRPDTAAPAAHGPLLEGTPGAWRPSTQDYHRR